MYKLEIKLRLLTQVFVPDPTWIDNYFYSFYTDAQKAKHDEVMQEAVTSGIMHSLKDKDAYDAAGFPPIHIDTETNTLTVNYLLIDPSRFCEAVVNDWDPTGANSLEPVRAYFTNHPEEGEYSFKVFDEQGTNVTTTFYEMHPHRIAYTSSNI
jgi:hypothetical protein